MLDQFLHRAAVRFNRHVGRPIVGRFLPPDAYAPIRAAFMPASVTASDLMADLSGRPGEAARLLSQHGVVILKRLIAPSLADAARQEADRLMEKLSLALAGSGDHGEEDGIAWQVGGARLRNQEAIVTEAEPIANIRSRSRAVTNGGVLDFYFIDKAARRHGWTRLAACCAALAAPGLGGLVASVSAARLAHVNMLRNDSITAPRGLHVDNLLGSFKIFLYLSDVMELGDGPYAYVPGSHRRHDLLRREERLNALTGRAVNDATSFEGRALPLLVERGDAVVSCQSGVHRGMPQRPGASRTVLVAHFRA